MNVIKNIHILSNFINNREKVSSLVIWGHWYSCFNIIIALLISLRYVNLTTDDSFISQIFVFFSWIGHIGLLVFLFYLLFLFPITLLIPSSKIIRTYAVFIFTGFLYYLYFDSLIYSQYFRHINPFLLGLDLQSIWYFLLTDNIFFEVLMILTIQIIIANTIWKYIEAIRMKQLGSKITVFFVTCIMSFNLIYAWADATQYQNIIKYKNIFPFFYPMTAKTFIQSRGIPITVQKKESNLSLKKQLFYPLQPLTCKKINKKIIFININGLQGEMINPDTMPHTFEFQQHMTIYNNHYSGSNDFTYGLFSMLYSIIPTYFTYIQYNNTSPAVFDWLKIHNIPLSIIANEEIKNITLFSILFDQFKVQLISNQNKSIAQVDKEVIDHTILQLNDNQMDFLFVHLYSPDYYAFITNEIETLSLSQYSFHTNIEKKILYNQYLYSIKFIDQELKRLLSKINENTIVILTSSHGKELDSHIDNKIFSKKTTHVPFIIFDKNTQYQKIEDLSTHYDIMPIIMDTYAKCKNKESDYSSSRHYISQHDHLYFLQGNQLFFSLSSQHKNQHDDILSVILGTKDLSNYSTHDLNLLVLLSFLKEGERFFINKNNSNTI